MPQAEFGEPRRYDTGFFGFFDKVVLRLLQDLRASQGESSAPFALHVIAPEPSPGDQDLFASSTPGNPLPEQALGEYEGRVQLARRWGCAFARLLFMLGSKATTPANDPFLNWQRAVARVFHERLGEDCKVTWWDDQESALADTLGGGAGGKFMQRLITEGEKDVPAGGYWAIYKDSSMQELLALAVIEYEKVGEKVEFKGCLAYTPDQIPQELRSYVDFCRRVYQSDEESVSLVEGR